MYQTIPCLDYPVFADDIRLLYPAPNSARIINTINAYSYVMAKNDPVFCDALKQSDILLPDGFPIVLAVRLLQKKRIKKIAGEDAFLFLMNQMQRVSGKVFFLGSSPHNLRLMAQRAKDDFPNVICQSYSPPFKEQFSKEDNDTIIQMVNDFHPDVLFVGMTAPKQEKWVFQHKDFLHANVICSIGAVFDFYAQTVKRPSRFWVNLNLEWFIRFVKEPRRLWKRYFIYSPKFFLDVFSAKIKGS